METMDKNAGTPDLTSVVTAATQEAQKVIQQEMHLLRTEMKDELRKGREAALNIGLGVGAGTLSAFLFAFMAVHAVHKLTRLPLWLSYGLVAGMLGFGGSTLVAAGAKQASDIQLVRHKPSRPSPTSN